MFLLLIAVAGWWIGDFIIAGLCDEHYYGLWSGKRITRGIARRVRRGQHRPSRFPR